MSIEQSRQLLETVNLTELSNITHFSNITETSNIVAILLLLVIYYITEMCNIVPYITQSSNVDNMYEFPMLTGV